MKDSKDQLMAMTRKKHDKSCKHHVGTYPRTALHTLQSIMHVADKPKCPAHKWAEHNAIDHNIIIQNVTMEDSGPSRENLTWTDLQMDYLVQLLVEQSRIPDMKSSGGLKPKAYTTIEKLMIERFSFEFTKDKIKNKLKYTKPNLTVMKEMLNTSGFGYDPINKCIQLDAQVWNDYIQRYPSRKKYRGPKVWRYYDEFAEVYGDSHATGQNAVALNSVLPDVTEPLPSTPASHTSPSYMQFDSEQSFAQTQNDDSPLQSPLPTTPTTEIPTNNTSSRSLTVD
ncbi:hypothetical protein EJ110_NYTH47083 [Nymphaea thermarum]|nr:hypothetical protein EJ110_NYTH47083 [Nymphaea thermarum]